MMDTNKIRIGYLAAHITSDFRYYDYLNVYLDPADESVVVTVSSTSPIGGMDGPGGCMPEEIKETFRTAPKPTASAVVKLVKSVVGNSSYLFKQYGKPTKRFAWLCTPNKYGLSVKIVDEALAALRLSL